MKPDLDNIDDVLRRHLPSASPDESESARARVLNRLRMTPDRAIASEMTERLDALEGAPRSTWRRTAMVWAAAAALIVVAVGTAILWKPAERLAVVDTVDTSLTRDVGGRTESLAEGTGVETDQPVRTTGDAGAVLKLADGSTVEMRAKSELSLERAVDGLGIRLHTGSIIVSAAKQRNGHLYVKTKDAIVSVVGTVFLVNADAEGSSVGVIEGEVHVRDGARETSLKPGQQVTTTPNVVARPLRDEIAWSRNVNAHLAILDSFTRGMTQTAAPLTSFSRSAAQGQRAAGPTDTGAAAPAFEEASIRQCDPDNLPDAPAGARGGGANSFQMTPGRTHALCMTLATLIRTAYGYAPSDIFSNGGRGRGLAFTNVYGLGVEDGRRVRGGPDWIRSERYTIDAVASDAADAATMSGPMLRALLEKRFHLQAHIESEQIPAFELTVAPGGLKMKEGVCTPPTASQGPPRSTMDLVRKNLDAARRGETTAAPCGLALAANGPNLLMVGAGAGIPPLTAVLGVPVTDRTGVQTTTRFNYVLEFLPDGSTAGPLGRVLSNGPDLQVASDPARVERGASLFTAIEEQLGLRLEPARAPNEFIVIDRVERVSPD